jgi:hypothetical protein
MAITTFDGLIGAARQHHMGWKVNFTGEAAGMFGSLAYLAGAPGAMVAPTPGLAGEALTSYAGQIPFPSAVGGSNVYLAAFDAVQGGSIGGLLLADRLWHDSGFTVTTTTAQTVNSVTWPARDEDGATSGREVQIGIEVSTATTNASAITNMTMSYTNSDGTSGRTGTVPSFPATAAAGTFVPFALAAGDKGVRSIQSLTLGTSLVTGTVHLVAYRRIAGVGLPVASAGVNQGPAELGFPRVFDNSVPFMLALLGGTAAGSSQWGITWVQG